MQCPYLRGAVKEITQVTHDPDTNDQQTIFVQTYHYPECKKEECAAWNDGWCRYKE